MNNTAAVLGPGAVGGSLAVRLANAGVSVVCVAHPEAAGLVALAGLVVESPEGTLPPGSRSSRAREAGRPAARHGEGAGLDDAVERVDPGAV